MSLDTRMKRGKSFQAEGTACAKASRQEKALWSQNAGTGGRGREGKTGNGQRPEAQELGTIQRLGQRSRRPAFCGSEEDDQRSGSLEPARGDSESSALLQGLGTSPASSGKSGAGEQTEAAS